MENDSQQLAWAALHRRCSNRVTEAIEAAEKLEAMQHKNYELRILRAPVVHLYAVWLHADDEDILIPAAPTPSQLQADRPYTERELVKKLAPLAHRRAQADRREERPQAAPSD